MSKEKIEPNEAIKENRPHTKWTHSITVQTYDTEGGDREKIFREKTEKENSILRPTMSRK